MNRDELYQHWDANKRYEEFIRSKCGLQRYKLLWDIRIYLEVEFGIEIDNIVPHSKILQEFIDSNYEIHNINTLFSQIKHSYFNGDEENMILIEIFYLIVFAELKSYYSETFKYTLKQGLMKIITDRSLGEKLNEFMPHHEKIVDGIIHDFSENLFV